MKISCLVMFVAVVFVFLFSFLFRSCGGGSHSRMSWGYFVASKALDGSLDHVDPQVVMSGQGPDVGTGPENLQLRHARVELPAWVEGGENSFKSVMISTEWGNESQCTAKVYNTFTYVFPTKHQAVFGLKHVWTAYQGISRQNIPGWSELWCPSALMLAFVTKKKGAVPLKSSHLPSTQSGFLSLFCLGKWVWMYIYILYLDMKYTYISWHVDFCSLILTPCWGSKREPRGLQWSNEEKMVTQPPGGDKKHHSVWGWKQHDTMICRDVWRATEVSHWKKIRDF